MTVAEQLLALFGSLGSLAQADLTELQKVKGIGRDKAITLHCAFTLAKRMTREIGQQKPLVDTPEKIVELLADELRSQSVETCYVVLLNSRNRMIRTEQISKGTLDSILIHPREVFRSAILHQAASIVLAHNHPSGDPTPSESDIRVTADLVRAGKLLNIDLLDHIIIGRPDPNASAQGYASLRELGQIRE